MTRSTSAGAAGSRLTQPHHDGSPAYVATASPSLGEDVGVRVRVPHAPDGSPAAETVVLRQVHDGEPAFSLAEVESSDASGTWWRADVHVRNPVTGYRFLLSGGAGGYRWLTGSGPHARDVTDAGDFRLVAHPAVPDWVGDAVAYQVFPDRFARSGVQRPAPEWAEPAGWDDPVVHAGPSTPRQWYGGDLDGVAQHLDDVRDLGANLLYLTPVFPARSNHRYDAVSFDRVDPVLGGDDALRRLVAAAHERGLRLVGDLTTNHTGDGHDWFTRAVADPASPEAAFYRFGATPAEYEGWLGHATLPKLLHHSPELRRRLYDGDGSVVARWLREGLDGWRIDVANMTGRSQGDDLAHEVARVLQRTLRATNPDAWLLAEHGHDAAADLLGDGWHGTMDYNGFTRPVWAWLNGGSAHGPGEPHGLGFLGLPVPMPVLPASSVVATMREVHAAMPWRSWLACTSHLDSHDSARFRTVTGGGTSGWVDRAGRGRPLHLVGLALQMTLPGVPSVFAGDELGLTGVDGEHARTPYPWHRREEWDAPTLAAYRSWIALRTGNVALRRGGLRWVHAGEDSMTFLREHPDQRVLVHAARAPHAPVRVPLAELGLSAASQLVPLAGEAAVDAGGGTAALPADGPGASVYVLDASA
jgi:alpha-glucosidase